MLASPSPVGIFCSIILRHAKEKVELILQVGKCLTVVPANYPTVGTTNKSGMVSPLSFLLYRARHS